jgi:hypothetical protein
LAWSILRQLFMACRVSAREFAVSQMRSLRAKRDCSFRLTTQSRSRPPFTSCELTQFFDSAWEKLHADEPMLGSQTRGWLTNTKEYCGEPLQSTLDPSKLGLERR